MSIPTLDQPEAPVHTPPLQAAQVEGVSLTVPHDCAVEDQREEHPMHRSAGVA